MPQESKNHLKRNITTLEDTVRRRKKTPRTTTKKKKTSKRKRKNSSSLFMKLFKFGFIMSVIVSFFVGIYVLYCYVTMPNIEEAVSRTRQPSTTIIAENGNDIIKYGNVYAQVIYPDQLPKNITNAIIAIEDHRFYSHFGFDVWAFGRAMITNIFKGHYAQGASTITQQVAKNIFLTPNKTIKRKVQELLLAFWLENKFTKNQIMALYLNRVYFGLGTYGAEAASNWYFNKRVNELNVREASILAGMLKAPNRYNPILNHEVALKRSNVVLNSMHKYGYLTDKQYKEAVNLPISDGQNYRVTGGKHFAQYVYDKVNNFIGERSADINVITTLDQKLQETSEKILRSKILASKDKNVSDGAVVVMDKTGAIKAMVGGIDYARSQFNRATQAVRQAGSAFKPFVYLTALQYGFTPDSVVNDAPIKIEKWQPENYTKRYYGKVSLDYALANSLNVATAVLARDIYTKDIASNAHKMGITTDISLTPSMVLGTSGVKVIDMATAYAVLANGGKKVEPHAITEISTLDGHQIYVRNDNKPEQIINAQNVKQMEQMLEHVITTGTGKKARLPYKSAGKTGTTQNYRDAWFVGWAGDYITAVWVGNDNDTPMNKVGGGSLPAEIWHDIMTVALHDNPPSEDEDFIAELIANSDDNIDSIGNLIENENIDDEPSALDKLINAIF